MGFRFQNSHKAHDRVPSYYAENKLYPGSYVRNDYPTRTSRRLHDGLSLTQTFGLDTVSDDVNSSPYSRPYYANGRYNSTNLTTQRGNSASVQGVIRLLSVGDEIEDFTDADVQTTIEMWQGKQIKFELPFNGQVVGNTLRLKNTDGCTGILSIYFSAKDGGKPIYETAIDLCQVSEDKFDHKTVYSAIPFKPTDAPQGKLYVRMEIWNEISQERTDNPFNTGRKIEIAATGLSNHDEAVVFLGDKNTPIDEHYDYHRKPSRPCMGLVYNNNESIPVNRTEASPTGASVSLRGYRYDVYCIKEGGSAELVIHDKAMNQIVEGTNIKVDGRATEVNIIQAEDRVYYVDGYSPVQKFTIGTWQSEALPLPVDDSISVSVDLTTWQASDLGQTSGNYVFRNKNGAWYRGEVPVSLSNYGIIISGTASNNSIITISYTKQTDTTPASISAEYSDSNPVIAPSLITFHNNRVYISGFRYDPNLIQFTEVTDAGPQFESFIYKAYAPDESPLATSNNPITALVEYESDTLMIVGRTFYSLYKTDSGTGTVETALPQQVSLYTDGGGVRSAGDICNYHGVLYSFDPDEGVRRFTGGLWNKVPASVDSHIDRVDMSKPRKLWGYANRLYFNYTDVVDGKYKCLVWDMDMNYQQYPIFQDIDLPFCDVRYDDNYDLVGIHPDYPCIMQLYAEDTWRRFDTPITFECHTKYLSLPGNSADMILKRVHNKVLANANRWWWFAVSYDEHTLRQARGKFITYRQPCWDTLKESEEVEDPFTENDVYEQNSVAVLTLPNLRVHAVSVQERIKCKTFRAQSSLISTLFESGIRQYL